MANKGKISVIIPKIGGGVLEDYPGCTTFVPVNVKTLSSFIPKMTDHIIKTTAIFLLMLALTATAVKAAGHRHGFTRCAGTLTQGGSRTMIVVYDCYELDEEPQFPGGESAMLKFINSKRNYPREAYRNRIEGRVTCGFVVNADGSISNVEVVRGTGTMLDNEAVRVVAAMPNWKAGRLQGEAVPCYYTVTIPFRL